MVHGLSHNLMSRYSQELTQKEIINNYREFPNQIQQYFEHFQQYLIKVLQFIIIYKYQQFYMDQKVSSDEIGEDAYPSVIMGSLKESSQLLNTDEQIVVKKLSNYANADFEERYYIVKNLSILISQIGQNSLLYIKPLLEKIIKDDKEITQLLLKQLPQLQKTISHLKQFQVIIKDSFIPTLLEYLNSNQLEIKEEAAKYLGKLTSELSDMDRGNLVLKHVIEMAHDDQNQNNRIVATQLFSSMGQCFGSQLCEQFIGFQILSLGEDISSKVRREAILNLPKIASLVSHQFFTLKFFPFYLSKCKDSNNWALRKACVETIVEISKLSETQSRVTELTQVMLFFLKDTNKWVKITAYKNLGPFINTLKGLEVNKKLIVEFTKMTEKEVNSLQKQNQIIYACAFNFPAVVDVLGPQKWESDLWKTYQKLLNSSDKNIKKTLSESLHVIATILGQQLTEKYLFPVADKYIKDKTNQIKLGMIRNISGLLGTLSMKRRIQLIDVFQQFQKDQKKWRIRLCIAKQLNEIGKLYDENTTFVYVVPTLFRFCSDPVYIIREQAADKVANFLENFKNQQIYQIGMIQNIKGFGISPKYTQRQTFLIMCKKLMQNPQLFHKHFMPILQALVNDKVLNVKLVLAQILKEHLEHKGSLSADEKLLSLIQKLKQDEDEEIKNVFKW